MSFQICLFLQMAPDSSCGCATCEWLTLQSSLVTVCANSVMNHATGFHSALSKQVTRDHRHPDPGPKRKRSLLAGTWRPLVECHYNTLLCCHYLSSSNVVSRAFSALCVYSEFRHHPHPLGYLCAKFRFFHGLHC